MSDVPLDFEALTAEAETMPTVQAGLITVLTRVRNAIEQALETDPVSSEYLRWLAHQLDANSPALADAIVQGTPAQEAHEARAAEVAQGG